MADAAVLLGKLDAHQARARRAGRELTRKCCASSHSITCGRSSRFGELAHRLPQKLLIVGEAHVHRSRARPSGADRIIRYATRPIAAFRRCTALDGFERVGRRHGFHRHRNLAIQPHYPWLHARRRPAHRRIRVRVRRYCRGSARRARRHCAQAWATSSSRRRSRSSGSSRTSRPAPASTGKALGTLSETNFGINNGGGVKISLIGPVRARVDYRVFSLRGSPIEDTVQRLYVGVNLKF